MENKSYYPLRISDKIGGAIVSDVPTSSDPNSGHSDIKYYGGHLIAESIPRHLLAQQLVDAYNEKYGPKEKHKRNKTYSDPTLDEMIEWIDSICNGVVITDAEITTHIRKALVLMKEYQHVQGSPAGKVFYDENVEYTQKEYHPLRIDAPAGTLVMITEQSLKNGSEHDKTIAKKLLKIGSVYVVDRTVVHNWHTDVYLVGFIGAFNSVNLVEYKEENDEKMISELDRDITPGDVINTALEEGSITLGQSFQLNTISHTDDWRNLMLQFQYENKYGKLTPEKVKEYMAKQPMRFASKSPQVLSSEECEQRVSSEAKNRDQLVMILQELNSSAAILLKFIHSDLNIIQVQHAANIMVESIRSSSKLLSCGNGGSYSDAQHFASELSGKYRGVRPAIAALALSDGGAMSCIANDFGFSHVFERQIEAIGRPGDTLLCLSTSGNSDNVVLAAKRAKSIGLNVIGIGGNSGGDLKLHCDAFIEIPHSGTADRIQELSIVIIHILVNLIERGIV